jgi:malate dehydrogenase (oxaloacetate-decarboxylating)(NADP+)
MGLSTLRGIFDKAILQKMAALNEHPIIFPLSNPSSNAECTFEEAMKYTGGKAIFASGSPFPPYLHDGKVMQPSQGKSVAPCPKIIENDADFHSNMYVFPGIGLGSILCKATLISQEMVCLSEYLSSVPFTC